MKFIESFEELRTLPVGTKVNEFKKGHFNDFRIGGVIANYNPTGVLIIRGDSNIKFMYERDFKPETYSLEYDNDNDTVAKLMIKQIKEFAEKEINDIEEVYLKK